MTYQHSKHIAHYGHSRTNDGNALRYVSQHKNHLRYIEGRGWMYWKSNDKGEVWEFSNGQALECARHTARMIRVEAEKESNEDLHKKLMTHYVSSLNSFRNMERDAKSDPAIVMDPDELDSDPWLINTPRGVVDLRTGTVKPSKPEYYMTKITTGWLNPDVRADGEELWDSFLKRIIPNEEDRYYLQCWAGYSATGLLASREKSFLVITGTSNTGKSKFVEAILNALGSYAGVVSPSIFAIANNASNKGHNDEVAKKLPGLRLAVAGESDDNATMPVASLKALTGDTYITTSEKFKSLSSLPSLSVATQ